MCTRNNALADARALSLRAHTQTMQQLLHVLRKRLWKIIRKIIWKMVTFHVDLHCMSKKGK